MGWNFDKSSKIRQKTKKSAQKNRYNVNVTSFWPNFSQKLTSIFYSELSEKFRKNWRHLAKKNQFSNYKYFFTTFGQQLAPYEPHFWATYGIFMFHLCFVLEVPSKISPSFKKLTCECRPIEKYATYEAKIFRKVVSKQNI